MFHEMVCTQPLKAVSSFQRMKVKQHSTATWPDCGVLRPPCHMPGGGAAPTLPHAVLMRGAAERSSPSKGIQALICRRMRFE